ncbi:MAG: hypothetical protein LKI17_05655 [Megasphaera cerevisiae]|jgi:galactitol-specific phosphotransferase system IIB component|nr:hypothetical protein [Megasphaera cerevisiae]
MIERDIYAICSQALATSIIENNCKKIAKSVQCRDYTSVSQILKATIASSITVCIADILNAQNTKKKRKKHIKQY